MNEKQINYLKDIGLSKLQSRIYISLLQESTQTGYKIAQNINEPVANTYKALEVLIQKGMALLDDSGNKKTYSALNINHYLNQLETNFKQKRKNIEDEFKKIEPAKTQAGIYKITNITQLYETAYEIIKNAKEVIAIDSTALPLELIKEKLESIAKKGIQVIIKTYDDIHIPNCKIIHYKQMGSPVYSKNIQYFNISIPGDKSLTALLNHDNTDIKESVYIKSKFLSFIAYNGILSEISLTHLLSEFSGTNMEKFKKYWNDIEDIRPGNIKTIQDYF